MQSTVHNPFQNFTDQAYNMRTVSQKNVLQDNIGLSVKIEFSLSGIFTPV